MSTYFIKNQHIIVDEKMVLEVCLINVRIYKKFSFLFFLLKRLYNNPFYNNKKIMDIIKI